MTIDARIALAMARAREAGARAEREALERELDAANDDGRRDDGRPVVAESRAKKPKKPKHQRIVAPTDSELAGVTDLDERRVTRGAIAAGADVK